MTVLSENLADAEWLAQFFTLMVLPFAHEDLAILLGGYIVVNDIMPFALVALCIYGGMVASDFALYGIGAGARRLPWLNRLAIDDRVHGFGAMLRRNVFGLVALCRVVPGAVFAIFVACGWTRVPLRQVAIASLVVSALYLPLMLCLVVFFGDVLEDRVGFWTWPLLLCVLAAIGFVRRQVFAFEAPSLSEAGTDATFHERPPGSAKTSHYFRAGERLSRSVAAAQRLRRGQSVLSGLRLSPSRPRQ